MNITKNEDGTINDQKGEELTLAVMSSARVMFAELAKLSDTELLEIAKNAEGSKKNTVARKVIEDVLANERPKVYDDAFEGMAASILRHMSFEISGISANIREQLNAKSLGLSLTEYYDLSLKEASEKLIAMSVDKNTPAEVTEKESKGNECESSD